MPTPPLTALAAAVLQIHPTPERVLEIECGDAEGALFLAREFPSARVRGIDPSPQRVREATARVGLDPEGRIAFKEGGTSAIPYPNDFFDMVAAVDAHPTPAEVARVLKPGGCLVLADSSRPGALSRLPRDWRRARLARHGFEPVHAAVAGDGDFYVARLATEGQSDDSI